MAARPQLRRVYLRLGEVCVCVCVRQGLTPQLTPDQDPVTRAGIPGVRRTSAEEEENLRLTCTNFSFNVILSPW